MAYSFPAFHVYVVVARVKFKNNKGEEMVRGRRCHVCMFRLYFKVYIVPSAFLLLEPKS